MLNIMENKGFIIFFLLIIILISGILTVIIHETGHLLGGIMSGYRFRYLKILFFEFIYIGKSEKSIGTPEKGMVRFRLSLKGPVGQCIMVTECCNASPELLIMGGCLANVIAAAISACAAAWILYGKSKGVTVADEMGICQLFSKDIPVQILFGTAVLNFIFGIFNYLGGSETSDGKTFREVKNQRYNRRAYNSLMKIYECILRGKPLSEVSDNLFFIRSVKSSLTAELLYYECRRKMESGEKGKVSEDEITRVKERLRILTGCGYRQLEAMAAEELKILEKKNECGREIVRNVCCTDSDACFSGGMGGTGSKNAGTQKS